MSAPIGAAFSDLDLVRDVFQRLATDLELTVGQKLSVEDVRAERAAARVAGPGQVHVSFKIAFQVEGELRHGCLLLPLPDAITVACHLLMLPAETIAVSRTLPELDATLKDALLEIGNFVAGSVDSVLRKRFPRGRAAQAEGCQGVRPDIRPAFPYQEGDALIVGRARAALESFPEFEPILMIPDVG